MTKTAEELAKEHWDWLGELLELVYKSGFVHGAKHEAESKKEAEG